MSNGVSGNYDNHRDKLLYQKKIFSIYDKITGKTFHMPKVFRGPVSLVTLSSFCNIGLMFKGRPEFIVDYLDASPDVYDDILIALYKDNPSKRMIAIMKKKSKKIIDLYTNGMPFMTEDPAHGKMIRFLNFGFASYQSRYKLYTKAQECDDTELTAYAIEMMNKFYPGQIDELKI